MAVDKELLRDDSCLLIHSFDGDLPKSIFAGQLFELGDPELLAVVSDITVGLVDIPEVLLEAFDLRRGDRGSINLRRVAENLSEEEMSLFFRHRVDLLVHCIVMIYLVLSRHFDLLESLLVDPVQEQGGILLEVCLLDEELPESHNVVNSDSDLLLRLEDQELDEVQHRLLRLGMFVPAREDLVFWLVVDEFTFGD